jgi:glycerophosphoryl diester phosphodiesterase
LRKPPTTPWPYPHFAAHRGAGKLAPENTLAAMRVGYAHGYRMVEFDAKLSADGQIILMHDDTVKRTSSGVGRVADLSWESLSRLDAGSWHSSAYAGEPIPLLATIAHYLIDKGIAANIEIKPCPGREQDTGHAVGSAARELWRDAATSPLLTSFSEAALEAAHDAAPELARGLLADRAPDDWATRLERLDCAALVLDCRRLTRSLAASIKDARYRLLTYTVNEPRRAEELLSWGIDCIITDAIDCIAPSEPPR